MRKRQVASDSLLSKIPPCDINAEEAVLGSIFCIEGSLTEARELLKPEDFYKGSHRKIFAAMLECSLDNGVVDSVVLANKLQEKEELETIGGAYYLAHLMDETPISANIKKHAEIIFRCSVLRLAIMKASEIIESAFDDKDTLDIFMAGVDDLFTELKEKAAGASSVENLDASFEQLFGNNTSSTMIQTPFKDLNEKIGGYGKKELTIVA
jgi:replicative DNA helicase